MGSPFCNTLNLGVMALGEFGVESFRSWLPGELAVGVMWLSSYSSLSDALKTGGGEEIAACLDFPLTTS